MGWEVIALGTIEIRKSASIAMIQSLAKALEEVPEIIRVEMKWEYINIEMSGNKGIDYSNLEKICNKYQDAISGNVSFAEYSETGDGFFFEPNTSNIE